MRDKCNNSYVCLRGTYVCVSECVYVHVHERERDRDRERESEWECLLWRKWLNNTISIIADFLIRFTGLKNDS